MQVPDDQAVRDILTLPNYDHIPGATRVSLTDSSALRTRNSQAEIYEWQTHKLPEHEQMSMEFVTSVINALLQDVDAARAHPELERLTVDQFREYIMKRNPMYYEFFIKAPRLFRMVVSPNFTEEKKQRVMDLIAMRNVHEQMQLPVETRQQHVSMYFREKFMRPVQPGEEEASVAAGTGIRATRVTPEHLARDFNTSHM